MERFKELLGTILGWAALIGVGACFLWGFTYEPPADTCENVVMSHSYDVVDDPGREEGNDLTVEGKDGEKKVCKNYRGEVTSEEVTINPVAQVTYVGVGEPMPLYDDTGIPEYQGGAICNDGWHSLSTGRGTCSWHGGVAYYL